VNRAKELAAGQNNAAPMWMAVAITAIIFTIGNILFGHFNEGTPKWKRVTKVVLVLAA